MQKRYPGDTISIVEFVENVGNARYEVVSNLGDIGDEEFTESWLDFVIAFGEVKPGIPLKTGLRIGEGFPDSTDGEVEDNLLKISGLPKSVTDE